MSTSYDVIHNRFLGKISDYLLMNMESPDVAELLDGYMVGALVQFKQCSKLSNRDSVARIFNDDLTDEEIEILSNLMVLEWLKPIVNNVEELKNRFSTKDYQFFSPANLLDKLITLRKDTERKIVE
jgi:hypothetical protein